MTESGKNIYLKFRARVDIGSAVFLVELSNCTISDRPLIRPFSILQPSSPTMAEPQPSTVQEGMDPDGPPPPADAEGRKAAAAMSSLETRGEEDGESKANKQIDQEALGKAISRLELADKAGKVAAGDKGEKLAKEKEEKEKRAKVKVDQADVGLLVEELDLTKIKATELLKAHEGDAVRAMKAFVRATA